MYNGKLIEVACEAYPGWAKIIDETHEKLKYLSPNYQIIQIKEKFGGLRYYFTHNSKDKIVWDLMNDVVYHSERKSLNLCEQCGARGETHKVKNWIYTLCNECFIKKVG